MGIIREASSDDLSRIKNMTDEYIGKDFYSMDYLTDILLAEDKYLYVYLEDNELVAYLYIIFSTLKNALDILHIPYDFFEAKGTELDLRVGVYKTTCTDKRCRGKGILTSFLNELESVFRKRNVKMELFTALQLPDGKIPVHKVVTRVGFTPVGKLENPWIGVDAYCPYCGNTHCTCDAVVYTKEMKSLDEEK